MNVDYLLNRLSKSKFRSSFHLNEKMKKYVIDKGYEKIESDAYDLINNRIAKANILNDGKQTPMRQVHPVFIAEHATATCCRGCINKWHHIEKGKELNKEEIDYIVSIIMKWIRKELSDYESK